MESQQSGGGPLTAKGPGAGVTDFLPIPATNPTDAFDGQAPDAPGDEPTFSHTLAAEARDEKGLAQQGNGHAKQHVRDLGWNEKKEDIAAPLVGGMSNEELWLLVRRFNKAGSFRRPHEETVQLQTL
jgi:hypothetical protein